jgi:phosphatidate cytidylyltransferase
VTRVVTAVVLLAVFLAALFLLPRDALAVVIGLIAAIGGLEWARLCGAGPVPARFYAGAVVLSMLAFFWLGLQAAVFHAATAFWIVAVPVWLAFGVRTEHRALLLGAGFLVLVPAALALVFLSPTQALLVLAVAWISDSVAYFVGRRWGRRKLAPGISPGKTWEGAAGGLAGAVAYAIILASVLAGGRAVVELVGASALLAVAGIFGDLFESAAKRQAGAKDSGALLPGHGGVLDRVDSATAMLPIAASMILLFGIGTP